MRICDPHSRQKPSVIVTASRNQTNVPATDQLVEVLTRALRVSIGSINRVLNLSPLRFPANAAPVDTGKLG
jgi:hypothetical protein